MTLNFPFFSRKYTTNVHPYEAEVSISRENLPHKIPVYENAATYLGFVHPLPDRASVHTQERGFRGDFCDGAKLRAAISKVESQISDRFSYYTEQLFVSARNAVRLSVNVALG